jgi:hypothetical protein
MPKVNFDAGRELNEVVCVLCCVSVLVCVFLFEL